MIKQQENWRVLLHILQSFWPPIEPQDGVQHHEIAQTEQRIGTSLPLALCEYYKFAGKRVDFIGNEDHLLPIEQITIHQKHLLFCVENQACAQWGIPLSHLHWDNPPVMIQSDHYPKIWLPASPSFSSFMLSMTVYATLLSGQFTGYDNVHYTQAAIIQEHYELLGIDAGVGAIFNDSQTLISVLHPPSDEMIEIRVCTKTKSAMAQFLERVNWDWEGITHQSQWWGHSATHACIDAPSYIIRHPIDQYISSPWKHPKCQE